MSTTTLRNDIAQHFGEAVAADDALASECISICQMYNISAERLFYKWESIVYNSSQSFSLFTIKSVPELKAQIQRDITAENAKIQKQQATSRTNTSMNSARLGGRLGGAVKFGSSGKLDAPLKLGTPIKHPSTRQGLVIKSETDPQVAGPSKVVFQGLENDSISRKKRSYKYMYEKVSERSEVLDERIDEFMELIQTHFKLGELGDPDASTEEPVTVLGRIVRDEDASDSGAKLGDTSIVLESSRMMGSGKRVPLRFAPNVKIRGGSKGIGGIGFFPGGIVALHGKNGGGGWFVVDEILALPPLKLSPAPPDRAAASFSMCIACGPFTADSDLDFKRWKSLAETLMSTKPAVVLLVGPFIDEAHPRIKDGDLDETPAEIFRRHFTERLDDFLIVSPGSTVLVVPSVHDIISDHAVFPQCELGPDFSTDPRIRLLPNPSRFTLNGVSVAVTSVDVLFHLRKDELFVRGEELDSLPSHAEPVNDAMASLCRNILQQRSFYPIFPTPKGLEHEVNLDITHSEELKLVESEDDCAPDILVLPSRLKQFAKVVDGTTVINPSFLSKGTYATLAFTGSGTGPAKERIKVEVSRLTDVQP
ncbi:DNA polymerase alpha/epsilon subunit B-domain-containing protein [Hygrophoropsis aurantiaca]|uniref:DNA polymerase alpha/epsilon subunit B-domain-containing protein n=1 Tax=Hygrophoropsis aurantiaca TaxID=72124 RepID=A0ACB8ABG6_9AGAM|nr:DNA polymerase alpha/epsilon subunit B-domain-containing protein [Hygrophoropsis aurantiaca]